MPNSPSKPTSFPSPLPDLPKPPRRGWSHPGNWALLFTAIGVATYAAMDLPDRAWVSRLRTQLETAEAAVSQRQAALRQTPPKVDAGILRRIADETARAETANHALRQYAPALATALAPETRPILAGIAAEFGPKIREYAQAARGGALSQFPPAAEETGEWTEPQRHWAQAMARAATLIATGQAVAGEWSPAIATIEDAFHIIHQLRPGTGHTLAQTVERGRLLETVAAWHLLEPDRQACETVAQGLQRIALLDPGIEPVMILARKVQDFRFNSMRDKYMPALIQAGRVRSSIIRLHQLARGEAATTVPLSPAVGLFDNNHRWHSRTFHESTGFFEFRSFFDRAATVAKIRNLVRRATPTHFGNLWERLPGMEAADGESLLMAGLTIETMNCYTLAGVAKDQRRLVLASYLARQWALTPESDQAGTWWDAMEEAGADGHRGPLTVELALRDLENLARPALAPGAFAVGEPVSGPALMLAPWVDAAVVRMDNLHHQQLRAAVNEGRVAQTPRLPTIWYHIPQDGLPDGLTTPALSLALRPGATSAALDLARHAISCLGFTPSLVPAGQHGTRAVWAAMLRPVEQHQNWGHGEGTVDDDISRLAVFPVKDHAIRLRQSKRATEEELAAKWAAAGGGVQPTVMRRLIEDFSPEMARQGSGPGHIPDVSLKITVPNAVEAALGNKRVVTVGRRQASLGTQGLVTITPVAFLIPAETNLERLQPAAPSAETKRHD